MDTNHCPNCGTPVPEPHAKHCVNCGASLALPPTVDATGGPPPPPPGSSVPFEDSSQPFMQRYLETVKLAFTDPTRLFSNMTGNDIGPPLIYGVINGSIAYVAAIMFQMFFGGLAFLAEGAGEELVLSTGMMILFLFLSPLLVIIGIFVATALFHVSLLILGDGQNGFDRTLKAVCYGGTPNLLSIVPFCGGLIGGIWAVVLTIMGAYYGHRTDVWRAILGYFLPTIVCCCIALFIAFSFGLIGAAASQ